MADINQVQLPDGSQYNIKDTNSGYATQSYVQDQISGITKATIGLGNVDNTSDLNKPVSTAQQTALNGKTNTSVIAYTESSATATKRYEIGDQFILSGVLYTATAIIPNGDPIVVDTNCSASDTIVEQIPNVEGKANKTDLASISETGATASQTISAGTYFYLDGTLVRAKTDIASGATFTENTNYEVVSAGALNRIAPKLLFSTATSFVTNTEITIAGLSDYDYLLYTFTLDGKIAIAFVPTATAFTVSAPYIVSTSVGAIYAYFTRSGNKLKCSEGKYSGTSSSISWASISGNQVRLLSVVGYKF